MLEINVFNFIVDVVVLVFSVLVAVVDDKIIVYVDVNVKVDESIVSGKAYRLRKRPNKRSQLS